MFCGRSQMLSQAQCRARLERIVKKVTDSATFLVPQAKWSNAALTKDQTTLIVLLYTQKLMQALVCRLMHYLILLILFQPMHRTKVLQANQVEKLLCGKS